MLNNVHGLIFTHNRTYNLRELTEPRCLSSVPFGGRFRMIDFMVSNMVNAGISDVGVILQSRYQSLLDHLGSGKDWDLARHTGGMRLLPPYSLPTQQIRAEARGQMDVLAGIAPYLRDIRQDYVFLADGDLVLNLPLEEVYQRHIDSNADITLVCTKQYTGDPAASVYFAVNDAQEITDVISRPEQPTGMEFLNLFLLSKKLLVYLTQYCATHNLYSIRDDLLPHIQHQCKLVPYLFDGFSTRCTSVASYFDNSMALLDPTVYRELFRPDAPIRTRDRNEPSTYYAPGSSCRNALVAGGCIIEGSIENSIIFQNVQIEKGACVKNCILFKGTRIQAGAQLNQVITDKGVTITPGTVLTGAPHFPHVIAKGSHV